MIKNYYNILGINKNASDNEIKHAYRKLAKKYHPDINKKIGIQEKFKELNEAYNILIDHKKRKNYDQLISNDFDKKLNNSSDNSEKERIMKEKDILIKIYKLGQIIIALLVAILIALIIGVSKMYTNNSTSTTTEESDYNTKYDVSMFKEITASDIKNETKDKLSVVYIGRETCGWCAAFLPNLWQAQDEYGYLTLYVDIAKIIDFSNGGVLDQDSYDILSSITGDGYEDYMETNLGSTPMILIMKDNKIIGAQTGYSEYDTFAGVLNDAGITK